MTILPAKFFSLKMWKRLATPDLDISLLFSFSSQYQIWFGPSKETYIIYINLLIFRQNNDLSKQIGIQE